MLHDAMYQDKFSVHDGKVFKYIWITRKEADDIFYEAMLVSKVPKWKALIMYKFVRMFGWLSWR